MISPRIRIWRKTGLLTIQAWPSLLEDNLIHDRKDFIVDHGSLVPRNYRVPHFRTFIKNFFSLLSQLIGISKDLGLR